MKQLKLTLEDVATLAVERLVEQGKLDDKITQVEWHFDTWNLNKDFLVMTQED